MQLIRGVPLSQNVVLHHFKEIFICGLFLTLVPFKFVNADVPSESGDMSSVWSSLVSWKSSVEALVGYVDSLAQENCEDYTCAEGQKLEVNPEHRALTNGCGSFGYNVDQYVAHGMTECCNDHDLCFSKCGAKKVTCDDKFKKCLYDVCKKDRRKQSSTTVCQISAKMLYGATNLAGCSSYRTAQSKACICKHKSRRGDSKSRGSFHQQDEL